MSNNNFEYRGLTESPDLTAIVNEIIMLESSVSTQQSQLPTDFDDNWHYETFTRVPLQRTPIQETSKQETLKTVETEIARNGNTIFNLAETLKMVQTAIARTDYRVSLLMEKVNRPVSRFVCDQCTLQLATVVSMECGGQCHLCPSCYNKGLGHICPKCKKTSSFCVFK